MHGLDSVIHTKMRSQNATPEEAKVFAEHYTAFFPEGLKLITEAANDHHAKLCHEKGIPTGGHFTIEAELHSMTPVTV